MLGYLLILTSIIIQSQSPLLADEEWVAEGWEITNRETYTISDYVQPYSVNENGVAEYFVDMCFTEEGEFRCAIAGDGEVVFINEDGSSYSVEIPEYRNISISPEAYLAVASDYENNQYLIDVIHENVTQISVVAPFFTWFFDNDSHITGVGRNSLAFCDDYGRIIQEKYYDDLGSPTFVQWDNASHASLVAVINYAEHTVEAYSFSGELVWTFDFPYATAGAVPLAISDDGGCVVVTQATNGFIHLNSDGEFTDHYLDGYHILSIAVSPEGNFVAVTATPDARGKPELHVFNIQSGTSSEICIPSDQWVPSVRSVTDDGILFCGYKRVNHYTELYGTTGRRLSLYDSNTDFQWISNICNNNAFECKNILQCTDLPVQINGGFSGCVDAYIDSYRLCYLDPFNSEIISLYIMHN